MPFSQETLDFLFENRLNDSKTWFEEHRPVYNRVVLEPFRKLVAELAPAMLRIDPQFITEPRVGRTISRIFRDTRFTKDKAVFRANMWFVFMREKRLYNGLPAFYFDLSPGGFEYGCGYWRADPASMESMRRLILAGNTDFRRADKALRAQRVFEMQSETYKRSRFPDQPPELRRWLDSRNLAFNRRVHSDDADFPLVFTDALAEKLAKDFALLTPVYHFLMTLESLREP